MLVKNKAHDIAILRTIGFSQGSIMRIFFLCGFVTGASGSVLGVIMGVLFTINIDSVLSLANYFTGGNAWDASIRGIYKLPAKLQFDDVIRTLFLSLGLSCVVTILPARNAARTNPVEALRNE